MKYEVVVSDQAKKDIAHTYSYILNTLQSRINADAVLRRLYSAIDELSFMAGSHHLYPNEPWHSEGVYYFSANKHAIFYILKENEDKTESDGVAIVIHVSNASRDLDAVLRGE
jgi:plasmid stabilization system protein ParE